MLHRVWADVHLEHLEHNVKHIQAAIPAHTKMMAVVKANAYGHGQAEVARKLYAIGIRAFAVATVDEAVNVRKHIQDADAEILILGMTALKDARKLVRYGLTQTVYSEAYTEALALFAARHGVSLNVHVKIDTGMNRIGFSPTNLPIIKNIFTLKRLTVKGIFTHLSVADSFNPDDIAYTRQQIDRFDTCLAGLKDLDYGKTHVQNSAGIMNYPSLRYDYVRPGIMLYGIPSGQVDRAINLKPMLELKSAVAMIKRVRAGEAVGYGRAFIAEKDMLVATIPIGYADGYPRSLSGKGAKVVINGQFARQIGTVCMDQMMVDVTNVHDIQEGDIVTLFGTDRINGITIDTLSKLAGTINNDLVCQLSSRVPRLYTTHSKVPVDAMISSTG